jgi:RNA recognition motif-containing protein
VSIHGGSKPSPAAIRKLSDGNDPAGFVFDGVSLYMKIYVGNLPFTADEAAVRTLFAEHGTVESVSLITDRETGRPRGFGFVQMPNADAQRAIQSLNGKQMGGRPLRVNEAQERERGGGGGGMRNGGGGGQRRW